MPFKLSPFRLLGFLALAGLTAPGVLAQTFVKTGDLTAPRIGHTATLLNDGRVLINGGFIGSATVLTSAELYDPATGTFSATGKMTVGRSYHTATLLPDGRVLITGGIDNLYDFLTSAELYDPATGAFTPTGSMHAGRGAHAATLLSTGKVLVSGTENRSLELYDPATGAFTPTGSVNGSAFGVPATPLLDGTVLLGGYHFGPDAAIYDPIGGNVQALAFPDLVHAGRYTNTLLPNGKVLLAGGNPATPPFSYCCAHLYDPITQTFQSAGPLLTARGRHTATLLPSGKVLIAGGYTGAPETDLASTELYDPATGIFTNGATMTRPRSDHTATLLRDGRVLIVGGQLYSGASAGPALTAELYGPPQNPTSGPPNPTSACGKYKTVNGSCQRIGILPWYAAIPGQWETDLALSATVADAVRFELTASFAFRYDGIGHNLQFGNGTIAESVGIPARERSGYMIDIVAGVDCQQSQCQTVPSTGSLVVTVDGPNASVLDGASVRATHKLLNGDGAVAGQADAPVIFRDQASNRWRAPVTDTPLSQQGQPGATVMSFAVANLSLAPQAVIVKVFDASGSLAGSARTPLLDGAYQSGPPYDGEGWVGGVYAVTLSGLLGTDLAPSPGGTVFRGSVTFEGEGGGKIAPLLVRMNWPAIASVTASPE